MFQHKHFGDHLRKVGALKNKKFKNESEEEWKDNVIAQADFYKEFAEEDDDNWKIKRWKMGEDLLKHCK